jgi:hypothetical protein
MRKASRANKKRKQVAREAQDQAKRIDRKYQNAATNGLNAASRSVGELNNGFREIADEMNEYSIRALENVFRAWQQFLDAKPLRQVVEHQARCAQNAYEAYVTEFARLGDLYINLTRRASEPLRQVMNQRQRASR